MKNRNRRSRPKADYRKLEDKVMLTVDVVVNAGGSMSISGVPDGQVQVISQGPQTFSIVDNGVPVALAQQVTQNIVVDLSLADIDDSLRIFLLDEAVNNVVVNLGEGTNDFQITGNSEITRVIYRGGSGEDTVLTQVDTERITAFFGGDGENTFVAENNSRRFRYRGGADSDTAIIGSSAFAGGFQAEFVGVVLGDGDNEYSSFINVTQNQYVRGGDDADRITSFTVNGTASFPMGNGRNTLFIARDHGRIFIRGGFDSDSVIFDPNSSVAQRVGIIVYGGADFVRVDGQITTNLFFNATDGDDQVFVNSSSLITGDVTVLFGGGLNRFTHLGQIQGDLYVASYNVADTYSIGGTVLGQLRLRPGGQ